MSDQIKILRVDTSPRTNSVSKKLAGQVEQKLAPASVARRDIAAGLPAPDEAWINANFTKQDDRTAEQSDLLRQSDELVQELKDADVILISFPIWNFGVPSALKGWFDLVARAGLTFRYTENGPEGLLKGKRAVLAISSGGTEVESSIDFATGYVKHALAFLGISDVDVVAADRLMIDEAASLAKANTAIEALAA